MNQTEKTIDSLVRLREWYAFNDSELKTIDDAIALLKQHAPVEPVLGVGDCPCDTWYVCPSCKILVDCADRYCSSCGKKLIWE